MSIMDLPQEVRRDRWSRYLVAVDGKTVGYTRATTVAKALDDTSSLMRWGERMTALGLAARPDLMALITTTKADDKKALDGICERAKEAGGATARRDLGTALHSMIERSYTESDYVAPEPYTADVAAVRAALDAAGFDVVAGLHERMIVDDKRKIAGTFDLVLKRRSDDRLIVADVKTGATIAYGALGFAVQLAIYANADALYTQGPKADGSTDRRDPMPELDKDMAVIVHVEPGSGVCTLHRLDIAAGLKALDVAMAVREWRTAKGLLVELDAAPKKKTGPKVKVERSLIAEAHDSERQAITRRIETLREMGAIPQLRDALNLYAPGVPTLKQADNHTPEQLAKILKAVEVAEAKAGAPFEDVEPTPQPTPAALKTVERPTPKPTVDEGGPWPTDECVAVRQVLLDLPEPQSTLAKQWIKEMVSLSTGAGLNMADESRYTRRRWLLAQVVAECVELGEDLAKSIIGYALDKGEGSTYTESVNVNGIGVILGHATADDAATILGCIRLIGKSIAVTFDENGKPVFVGATPQAA